MLRRQRSLHPVHSSAIISHAFCECTRTAGVQTRSLAKAEEKDNTVEVTENVLRRLAEAEVRKDDKKNDRDYEKAVDQAYVSLSVLIRRM